jgi:hypothetical protein
MRLCAFLPAILHLLMLAAFWCYGMYRKKKEFSLISRASMHFTTVSRAFIFTLSNHAFSIYQHLVDYYLNQFIGYSTLCYVSLKVRSAYL